MAFPLPEMADDSQERVPTRENFVGQRPVTKSLLLSSSSVVLDWPGREQAFGHAKETARCHFVPAPGGSLEYERTNNLFIEGDNLEALKLLEPEYGGRVKLIYIDPPYNTGREFTFPDRVEQDIDRSGAGQTPQSLDAAGPTSRPAPRHSRWLSMMYPRLALARGLLREDGAIFVSIDDHEAHHLRVLMDMVFGEACFKSCIITRRGVKNVQAQFDNVDTLAVGHEYLMMYARSPSARFRKLALPRAQPRQGVWNNHWRGTDRPTMRYELFSITPTHGQWRWSRERSQRAAENYQKLLEELAESGSEPNSSAVDAWYARELWRTGQRVDLLRLSARGKPEHYVPPSGTQLASDLWTDLRASGKRELQGLFGQAVFQNPKPIALLERILEFTTRSDSEDIVLDFFGGSGTTAEAVFTANARDAGNRRFVLVQRPERLPQPLPLEDGRVLETIAEVALDRIRRAAFRMKPQGQQALSAVGRPAPDLGFRLLRIATDAP